MVATIMIVACANIGTPDGGPYDETPPHIVHTTPEFKATNVTTRKIVLEFDENIRIDNAAEKVVVSPPQTEAPEVNASGHKITVELIDSLQPGVTYTIDFADAIEDNNEHNPMGDYAFTFSTGDSIDTMQVSGYVLDASNLEPIKGIMVGLYGMDQGKEEGADTLFTTTPFERISRTDSRGHFIVKGLARKQYLIYALQDQDQSYTYSQKSEMLAFHSKLFVPYAMPDLRPDTVWHDSIHYDSIVLRPYTHFYPDNIVLLAFNEKQTDRYFLKAERPNLWQFTLYFTNAADTLPIIKGLNFDATEAFVVEPNPTNDTINYWIRDSLVYNLDTLDITMQFMGTDTLGELSMQTDTLSLISKISRERLAKQREKEYEDWVKEYRDHQKQERKRAKAEKNDSIALALLSDEIPPMPEKTLELRVKSTTIDPISNVDIVVPEPLASIDTSLIHLNMKVDTIRKAQPYLLRNAPMQNGVLRLYAEWEPGANYEFVIDSAAFVSIYGLTNYYGAYQIKVRNEDSYGYVRISLDIKDQNLAVVQLLNGSDKVVKSAKPKDGAAEFFYVQPGTYYLRMFIDYNDDGEWNTGNYELRLPAEPVYYYPGALTVKAGWDLSQDWQPLSTPIYQQKPDKITKQKPDKEKTIKNRNADRNKKK